MATDMPGHISEDGEVKDNGFAALRDAAADRAAKIFVKSFVQAAAAMSETVVGKKMSVTFRDRSSGAAMSDAPANRNVMSLPQTVDVGTARGRRTARAHIDTAVAWQKHHDDTIHAERRPKGEEARAVFDMLERARCDSLLGKELPGAVTNIDALTEDYIQNEAAGDKAYAQALRAAYMMARASFEGREAEGGRKEFVDTRLEAVNRRLLTPQQKALNLMRRLVGMKEYKATDSIMNLSGSVADQDEFARKAKKISELFAPLFNVTKQDIEDAEQSRKAKSGEKNNKEDQKDQEDRKEDRDDHDDQDSEQENDSHDQEDPDRGQDPDAPDQDVGEKSKDGNRKPGSEGAVEGALGDDGDHGDDPGSKGDVRSVKAPDSSREIPRKIDIRRAFEEIRHAENQKQQIVGGGRRIDLEDIKGQYRIYTTEFDRVVRPEDMVSASRMSELRCDLDDSMGSYRDFVNKLALRLQRRLMAMQMRAWELDLEDGRIDPARLSRIVTDTGRPRAFRQERVAPFKETAITLLVDNSGSMKNEGKSMIAAITTEILAMALEKAGIKTEILGFSTSSLDHSDVVRKLRRDSNRLGEPGRLDALRHIVYKTFNEPYRRVRDTIPVMTAYEILCQNHDGEALVWAHNRLIGRAEERKILMVISDGYPEGNYEGYQSSPSALLSQVTKKIEQDSPVELVAIGICSPVGRYYRNAIEVAYAEHLAAALMTKLDELFVDPANPRRRIAPAARPEVA